MDAAPRGNHALKNFHLSQLAKVHWESDGNTLEVPNASILNNWNISRVLLWPSKHGSHRFIECNLRGFVWDITLIEDERIVTKTRPGQEPVLEPSLTTPVRAISRSIHLTNRLHLHQAVYFHFQKTSLLKVFDEPRVDNCGTSMSPCSMASALSGGKLGAYSEWLQFAFYYPQDIAE